jgi:peptidase E
MTKHIIAASGGFVLDGNSWRLGSIVHYGLALTGKKLPKNCFITTASGDQQTSIAAHLGACKDEAVAASHLQLFPAPNVPDIREHILSQDMVWVAGGSDANMLAVWQVHGLDDILREAWNRGIVLAGISAGSVCWHTGGVTDSFGATLQPLHSTLNLLPYSNNVHYDSDEQRRAVYHDCIAQGTFGEGYATDDNVALHYIDDKLHNVIADVPGKYAYHVSLVDGSVQEEKIAAEDAMPHYNRRHT